MNKIKKYLLAASLLSIALTTAALPAITASAEEGDAEICNGGSAIVQMHDYVTSSYCVLIPAEINTTESEYTFQASMMNITDDESVQVKIVLNEHNRITYTYDNGGYSFEKDVVVNKGNCQAELDDGVVGYFLGTTTVSEVSFKVGENQYSEDLIRAGSYTANVEFVVEIAGK